LAPSTSPSRSEELADRARFWRSASRYRALSGLFKANGAGNVGAANDAAAVQLQLQHIGIDLSDGFLDVYV
jgi:hypothetical protein